MPGNPVLLLHGFTTSAERTWREPGWIDLLTDAGREVIAPDLLGHGDAPKPHDPADYDQVEQRILDILPDGPVDAVGYSAGARIVLYLAANHPERFGKLVVGGVGKTLFEPRDGGHKILAALQGDEGVEEDMVAQHFKQMASENGNDPVALTAFIKRRAPELTRDDVGRITNPTLVVIGDKDFAGPGEPLAEALPEGQLLTLPGVDHFGLPKAFPFLEKGLEFLGAAPF